MTSVFAHLLSCPTCQLQKGVTCCCSPGCYPHRAMREQCHRAQRGQLLTRHRCFVTRANATQLNMGKLPACCACFVMRAMRPNTLPMASRTSLVARHKGRKLPPLFACSAIRAITRSSTSTPAHLSMSGHLQLSGNITTKNFPLRCSFPCEETDGTCQQIMNRNVTAYRYFSHSYANNDEVRLIH